MHKLSRNCIPVHYCLYTGNTKVFDENGNETGELIPTYAQAEEMYANVSPARGMASVEMFGNLDGYDRVMVTDWVECPIDENSVLFVDKDPVYDEGGHPIYDYIVRRVAKSLNFVAIAIGKVSVQ